MSGLNGVCGLGEAMCLKLDTRVGTMTKPVKLALSNLGLKRLQAKQTIRDGSQGQVWIVDDDAVNCDILKHLLADHYNILTFSDPMHALEKAKQTKPDVVVTDQRMPTMLGTEFLARLREIHEDTIRLIVTGYTDVDDLVACINEGLIFRYIVKPWDANKMQLALSDSFQELYRRRMEQLSDSMHQQKIRSMNLMLAGIAHEISTPLGICLTSVSALDSQSQNLRQKVKEATLNRKDLSHYLGNLEESCQLMEQNLNRSAKLVQSFRAVTAAHEEGQGHRFSPVEYLHHLKVTFQTRLTRLNAHITIEGDEALQINSQPSAWVELGSELIRNALTHAFDGNVVNPTLTIKLDNHQDKLRLIFQDNGCGVELDNRSRLFDPFFTTKRAQKHLGLGLHKVEHLVRSVLKGTIEYQVPTEGHGAIFSITFEPNENPGAAVTSSP
jgi:signal transduction histidine kinase